LALLNTNDCRQEIGHDIYQPWFFGRLWYDSIEFVAENVVSLSVQFPPNSYANYSLVWQQYNQRKNELLQEKKQSKNHRGIGSEIISVVLCGRLVS
jgi:hypothetical protein